MKASDGSRGVASPLGFVRRHSMYLALLVLLFVVYQFPIMSFSLKITLQEGTAPVVASSTANHQWWESYVDQIAQPFQPWNGTEWCKIDTLQSARIEMRAHDSYGINQPEASRMEGFMLGKVHKAASTTSASVTLRIAYRVAQRRLSNPNASQTLRISPYIQPMCHAHFFHDFTTLSYHSRRNPAKSFLWSTVRLPDARSESAFYYYVRPTLYGEDDMHLKFLAYSRGHQVRLLRRRSRSLFEYGGNLWKDKASFDNKTDSSMGVPSNAMIQNNPDKLAFQHIQKEILAFYDFIAVTERWMESMAVLKLLLPELQYSDLIVLRVKESGGYVAVHQGCKFLSKPPSRPPPVIEAYLNGPFRETNPDYLLYAAVNRSLDLTIETLGRQRVDDGVRQIQYLQALAQEKCQNEIVGACTETGQLRPPSERNCYVKDFGCGHRCVDRVLPDDV